MAKQEMSAEELQQVMVDRKTTALEVIRTATAEIQEAETRLHTAVDDLRVLELATWEEIAEAAGITEGRRPGATAYQRYGTKRRH